MCGPSFSKRQATEKKKIMAQHTNLFREGGREGGGSNLEEDNVRMLELSHDAGLSEEVGACLVAGARLQRLDRHTVQII